MNEKQYQIILSLYKKKVQNLDIKSEVEDYYKSAIFELDKLCVNSQSITEQEEYIKELQELMYEYF